MTIYLNYKGLLPADAIWGLTPEVSATKAQGTLYEAWFNTLKISPFYNKNLDDKITGDTEAAKTVNLFGDLRNREFKEWWLEIGYQIFAEPTPYQPIQEITDLKVRLSKEAHPKAPRTIIIEVPLNLDPAELSRQFATLVSKQKEYQEEFKRWEMSQAEAHQDNETKLTFKTIQNWLEIYAEYEHQKKFLGSEFKLYNFTKNMGLHPYYALKSSRKREVPESERIPMSNVASDLIKKTKFLMANAAEMRFPDTTPNDIAVRSKRNNKSDEGGLD
jgi:hypothetical protein